MKVAPSLAAASCAAWSYVVPFLEDPRAGDPLVVLIRQFRHAADGFVWEVPAGRLDPEAETVVFNTGDGLKTLEYYPGAIVSGTVTEDGAADVIPSSVQATQGTLTVADVDSGEAVFLRESGQGGDGLGGLHVGIPHFDDRGVEAWTGSDRFVSIHDPRGEVS